jgi:aryl-alcohol dehydrogenase-like predicted oxidoreductase
MKYRTLGRTGVKVSPLCLGAMMFGAWGNPDHDESVAVIHAALDAGINFIDTADVYSAGESGRSWPRRCRVGAMTPALCTAAWAGPNMQGNSRRWIIQEAEQPQA